MTQAKALLEKMIVHAEEDLRDFDELMAHSNAIDPPMYPPGVLLSVSQAAREHLQTLQELLGILG